MNRLLVATVVALALGLGGCGLAYQVGNKYRTNEMIKSLKVGETSIEVHNRWGEPDIRFYPNHHSEIWSYAIRANSNDLTATILYTAPKPGDRGTFLDLLFVNGTLVSWHKAVHTMPVKKGAGFSTEIVSPPVSGPTYHY